MCQHLISNKIFEHEVGVEHKVNISVNVSAVTFTALIFKPINSLSQSMKKFNQNVNTGSAFSSSNNIKE